MILEQMPTTVIDTARDVLLSEAAALTSLSENLPSDFEAAVSMILERTGKVVVGGVGKSGHIARKMAATLSSTGSPAFFIHPTEAAHGDLGMIEEADTVILISNSGETNELLVMLEYCQRFSIPVIGISSVPGSTLMMASTFRLLLPKVPEACPIRLAPMTSTTMTLALGDALAASLMQKRGFSPTDFGVFHPGGKLGVQLMRVGQVMHDGDRMPLLAPETPMKEAVLTISEKGFGTAGVVEGGKLVGIITDGDVRRNIDGLFDHTAQAIMTKTPITTSTEVPVSQALSRIEEHSVSALFVTNEAGEPIGIVHLHDLLRLGVQ
ncbi:KpsF/GutQ family sugar-phosphate isomerase [uncultured Maritimibacter sp.]|uniref:KpsF/GutQ family sugar-phosphate isomerase n=2 Tax=Maritimibacter TaxID=404235 RepID=UPI00267A7826|tara:strand:+ start:47999 stop:48967 length:969 start_codon:yes stop_codon:yes gene_type:complete